MKLRLISREQETFENAFRKQIEMFQAIHPGIEFECEFLPIQDHFQKMVVRDTCLTGDYDLFLCTTDWLPQLIENQSLVDIGPMLRENPPPDWPEGWHPAMRQLQQRGNQVFGFPWHDGPEVFHYRSDLFEDPAERRNFRSEFGRELEVPTNWDDFLEVAQFFTRPKQGLWGCCEAAFTDGHNNVYDFLIHLWSRGGELINSLGEVAFDSEIGVRALQYYVDLFHLHQVISPECLKLGSVECGDYYAAGNAAMMWNWCGFAAVCEMPEFSKIVGKNRCTRLPSGEYESTSLNIYWVLTIPKSSRQVHEAYEFIRFIGTPEADKVTSMAGANGVRLSTWNNSDVRAKYPHYEIIEAVHGTTRTLPAIPEYPEINECISRAVHRALHRQMPVRDSLKLAATEAAKILHS